jgi:hypothetical protein
LEIKKNKNLNKMSKCCWDICKFLLFIINFAALVSLIFRYFFTTDESYQFLRNRFYFRKVFERFFSIYIASLALLFVVFYSIFMKLSGSHLVVIRFIIFRKFFVHTVIEIYFFRFQYSQSCTYFCSNS